MSIPWSYRLKGGAIIYVLLISSLISGLLAAFVMLSSFESRYLQKHEHLDLARENLRSGLHLYLQNPLQIEGKKAFQLFTAQDSCWFSTETWGLFSLVHARAKHSQSYISKSALIGEGLPDRMRFSLHLADFRQPLTVVGNTRLEGEVYLPGAGIRPGHIGKISFNQSLLSRIKSGLSKKHQTGLSPSAYFPIKNALQEILQAHPAADHYVLRDAKQEIPWHAETFHYQSPGNLELSGCSFSGKCVIKAAGTLTIKANCTLTHTLIFARKIRIEKGFRGMIQAYALESIEIEEGVKLAYPSVLMTAKGSNPTLLTIGKEAEIEGAIIMDHSLFSAQKEMSDYCLLDEHAELWGLLYATHNLDIKGSIHGSVITDGFLLKTPGRSYRNHLMHARISFRELSPEFAAPLLFGRNKPQLIEWL